jgi:uncharacterized protein (TIGR02231 family)
LSAFCFQVFAQNEKPHTIKSNIKSAIIYLEGAELSHIENVKLNAGKNLIVFDGLSPKLNSKSIQVSAGTEVSILSISDKKDFLTNEEEKPKIKQLKDSVELITRKNIAINDEKDALQSEKDLLLTNKSIGGNNTGVAFAELKQTADFFRTRIKEINTNISALNAILQKNNETLGKLNRELSELNALQNIERSSISVLLLSDKIMTAEISLKYLVNDAGWTPSYDLVADEIEKPITLSYRAKVFNNTGIDWENLKIKLSTANPWQSASKPLIKPWYLNYKNNVYTTTGYPSGAYNYEKSATQAPAAIQQGYENQLYLNADNLSYKNVVQKGKITYEEIEVSELSAEFEIKNPYSFPSDAKPYIVDVTEHQLNATYQHYAIPKVDKDAFLLARISGWEDLNLVEGPANVYFAGTYLGQSYIYTRNVSDTLDLSLGRDKKVLVTRTKLKDYSSKKLIGSSRKETYAYEIAVKNNRKAPINIEVIDQIPVSQDSEIEVETHEISKAEHKTDTGELKWMLKMDAGQTQKLNLSYSIKYPKTKTLYIDEGQKRKAMRAKF